MADCLNCHQPMPDTAATCPRCGADVEKMRAILAPRDASYAPRGRPSATADQAAARSFPVVPVILLLAAVGVVAYLLMPTTKAFPQVTLPPAKANTQGTNPCLTKEKCVIVYMAPWCPFCQRTIPIVQEMVEHYKDSGEVGVKVIIGNDGRGKLEDMAEKVGTNTFLDPDGTLWNAVGAKGVPHWFVLDSTGKQVAELGGFGPMAAILKKLELP